MTQDQLCSIFWPLTDPLFKLTHKVTPTQTVPLYADAWTPQCLRNDQFVAGRHGRPLVSVQIRRLRHVRGELAPLRRKLSPAKARRTPGAEVPVQCYPSRNAPPGGVGFRCSSPQHQHQPWRTLRLGERRILGSRLDPREDFERSCGVAATGPIGYSPGERNRHSAWHS